MFETQNYDFPNQKVPNGEKTLEWVAQSVDWIIGKGKSMKDEESVNNIYDILKGVIPDEYYKKTLNPYNATQDRYTRLPATMRNYDMIKGIIRRYVSEYLKGPHDFIVGANNPDVVLAKNAKLASELSKLVEAQIASKIQQSYAQWVNEGNSPEEFNPQDTIDVEAYIKEFNENYIDDISEQGQNLLNVIKDITEDALFYARAYFDYVTFGEVYTYGSVEGTKLIKRNIQVKDAFPVHTDNFFKEDDDMFACRRMLTYNQILDEFDKYLDDTDRKFLEDYYTGVGGTPIRAEQAFSVYESYFPEVCNKFSSNDRETLRKASFSRESNTELIEVWHVTWKGYVRKAIVTYSNEVNLITTREEEDDYKLDPSIGDISIEYVYVSEVHEAVRIGTRYDAIYPYGARTIAYDRKGKLPYNGISELMPGLGKFSIPEIVIPYQVFRNIVSFHREMAIAKNKLSILMIAKSLLGTNREDTIHKILADGVLYYDDTDDAGALRAQQVRMLNASIGEYINQLSTLIDTIEQNAKNQVDMTPQRYGEIANSAGNGVTQEAISRGSMGTVIIEFMMDMLRERDYAREMDNSKLAWIDGLDTSFRDNNSDLKYISLNVDKHSYADYIIKAKHSAVEKEKLEQLKQFAFSAAQNGDSKMAIAAITGDNVATIVNLIKKYDAEKQAHDQQLKQLEQQIAQMEQEFELKKIQAKGEQDRETAELEGIIEAEIELIKADANMISFDNGVAVEDKNAGMARLDQARTRTERDKLKLQRESNILDAYSKEQDRQVKREDIAAKVQIAKTNRNRFDVKSKSKAKK